MLLGDLGADVLKVELPALGDDTRRWGPPFVAGESTYYLAVNRNKRSLTLNLKHPRAQELLRRLVERADVLVENFKPGTLEALGLGYEQLRQTNPRLIYCAISAFGPRGPYKDRPGYDFAIQAIGGIMSLTGEPDGEPMKVGVAIVDVTAGLYALGAILAALRARDRDGAGQRVEVSLFQSQLAWLVNVASAYLIAGQPPRRHGNAHASVVPYQSFRAADDWLAIAAGNDGQFRALVRVLGQAPLADDVRFATNPARVEHREALIPRLADAIAAWPAADLLAALERAGVPCAPINTLERVFADPQVEALGAVLHADHPTVGDLPLVRWPFELSGTPAALRHPPPLLGQHTDDLLAELGLRPDELAALRAEGAI
ncbi:MAG TPA: CoA transferase [Chloroflexota bacterium]|jgi:formyl-CoA transferase